MTLEDHEIQKEVLESSTPWNVTESSSHSYVSNFNGLLVLEIVLPLSFLLLGLLGSLFILRRHCYRKLKKTERVFYDKFVPLSYQNYETEYQSRVSSNQLEEEYNFITELSSGSLKLKSIGEEIENRSKNRFIDVIPYDDTLVRLQRKSSTEGFYINASHIRLPHPSNSKTLSCKYIATQGPKRNTMIDFWRMVIQENTCILVCLTNVFEGDKMKCFQYWPNVGEMLHFNEITLHTLEEKFESQNEVLIRRIQIEMNETCETRKSQCVTQIHYTAWPETGVPQSSISLLQLCQNIRQIRKESKVPFSLLTHCSSGVGRTGVFIALEYICQQLVHDSTISINVPETLLSMREQRPKMLQTLDQYNFLYSCINDFIKILKESSV